MKIFLCVLICVGIPASTLLRAQVLDGTDVGKELLERDERIGKLSIDEQLKLRAAQQEAAKDPAVLAALKKRNEAINEFRAAIRAAMIKADPTIEPILQRVAMPDRPTP